MVAGYLPQGNHPPERYQEGEKVPFKENFDEEAMVKEFKKDH